MNFVLLTQEPGLLLKKIDQLKLNVLSINKKVAMVGAEVAFGTCSSI
jgi:hypothetical protein